MNRSIQEVSTTNSRGLLSKNQFEVECMIQQRVPLDEIATHFQTIKSNVSLFLKRRNISIVTQEQYLEHYKEEITALIDEGQTPEDIEGWLGVKVYRIRQFLSNIKKTEGKDSPAQGNYMSFLDTNKEDILYMVNQHVPLYVIADRLYIDRSYISKWIKKNEITTLSAQEYIGSYREEIEELLGEGRELEEISGWLGVKTSGVKKFIDINKILPKPAYGRHNSNSDSEQKEARGILTKNKEEVLGMIRQRVPLQEIADTFGVTQQYVSAWCKAQKQSRVTVPEYLEMYIDEILEMLKEGRDVEEVSKWLGVACSSVQTALAGMKVTTQARQENIRKAIEELAAEYYTQEEIAKKLYLSKGTIAGYCQKFDIETGGGIKANTYRSLRSYREEIEELFSENREAEIGSWLGINRITVRNILIEFKLLHHPGIDTLNSNAEKVINLLHSNYSIEYITQEMQVPKHIFRIWCRQNRDRRWNRKAIHISK